MGDTQGAEALPNTDTPTAPDASDTGGSTDSEPAAQTPSSAHAGRTSAAARPGSAKRAGGRARTTKPTAPEPAVASAKETEQAPASPVTGSAEGTVLMGAATRSAILDPRDPAHGTLGYARLAGALAAKRTGAALPDRFPPALTSCAIDIEPLDAPSDAPSENGPDPAARTGLSVRARCQTADGSDSTPEALSAVFAACLAMLERHLADDPSMEIVRVRALGGPVATEASAQTIAPAQADDAPVEHGSATPAASEERPAPAVAPAIAFIGYQNSGKTTLVEKIIARLTKRGLRVGTIKHHDHKGFDIDQPGRDSWRHAQAGSRHVGLISPGRYAEYADTASELPVSELLAHYTDVDVVIVEGYKTAGLPNIIVTRSGVDRLRGDTSYDLIDDNTIAIACNDIVERDFRARAAREADESGSERALPDFLGINDAAEIVNFILRYLKREK